MNAKDYYLFHVSRKITNFYKNVLVLLEDKKLPPAEFIQVRKRILDYGNDTIRELKEIFDNSKDIGFKD